MYSLFNNVGFVGWYIYSYIRIFNCFKFILLYTYIIYTYTRMYHTLNTFLLACGNTFKAAQLEFVPFVSLGLMNQTQKETECIKRWIIVVIIFSTMGNIEIWGTFFHWNMQIVLL